MDPILIGRKRLRAPTRGRGGRIASASMGVLLVLVGGAGFLQSRVHAPVALAAAFHPVATATFLPGTHVVVPPATVGFHTPVLRHGLYTFRLAKGSARLTGAQSQVLFAYFVDVMARAGWALQATGSPTSTGEWTLSWTLNTQTALISMTTSPKDLLSISLCPPNPYC